MRLIVRVTRERRSVGSTPVELLCVLAAIGVFVALLLLPLRTAREPGPSVRVHPGPRIAPRCHVLPAFDVATTSVLPEEIFAVGDRKAFLRRPARPAAGGPWVWYAPTLFGNVPNQSNEWLFARLLDRGIAVAGIDVGESYGSPAGRAAFSAFYDAMAKRGLSKRPVLLAQSRGGLMLYNWAAENPEKIGGIAGIYPVCDLRSYPGLERAAPAYGMTPGRLEANLSTHNPIDRLKRLADKGVPIFHIHGDSDATVPLKRNSRVIFDRYTALGGRMELVVVLGKGHAEVPEFFHSKRLLDFIVKHADPAPHPPD